MEGSGETNGKIHHSTRKWLAVGLFLLALCVRGVYLYDSSDNPTFSAPIVDSMTYDLMARKAVEGAQITDEFFWQPLFYPLFLSAVYFLSDSSIVLARIVQALLGCVTCVLIYRLGERIFGRSAGILAGLIAAVYGPMVFFETELLAAGWAAFWSVVVMWVLIGASEKPSVWRGFVLGLCGILSIITRPVFVPFFAAGCIWLMVVWLRRRVQPRKLLLGLVGVAAGVLVVAAPVGFLSYQTTGKATVLPNSGGVNFYIGNNPDYKETIAIRPGLRWQELMVLPNKQGIEDRYERQRFFVDKTVRYVVGQPLSFFQGLVYKATQFCSSREVPRNVDVYSFRKWSLLLRAGVWKVGGFGFPFGVLLPLAVVGGVYWRRIIPGPIWLYMIFYPASVILVFVTSRYRVPIVPLMSVLAAGGCAAIWNILKGRQSAQLVVAGVIILGTCLASGVPGPFVAEQIDYEPELYYGLGDSLDKRGQTDAGIESYYKAISLRSDYVEAHHNVALLLTKQKRSDEAIAHLSAAIKLEPNHAVLYKDLGNALIAQGKVGNAIASYNKAIQLDPTSRQAHRRLGLALASLGKFDAAIKHYLSALEFDPDDAETHYSLGVAYQMKGELDKAVRQYSEAVEIDPGLDNAHSNLGVIFARRKEYDKAIKSLSEALRLRPDSAETQYNLGLVFRSKGQIDEAIEAFNRVLAIEPTHKRANQALQSLPMQKAPNWE
jgi:tetratricopeptide (TPR) repeat protein